MVKWAIELSQFDIEYRPRTARKAQALADFIAKFTTPKNTGDQKDLWTINTNELSTQKEGGAGVVITSPEKDVLKYGVQLKFPITNNEAEYKALLTGLRIARALGAENIVLKSDSQLVIGQVRGDFEAKETRMQKYLKLTNQLVSTFHHAEFIQIPWDHNAEADEVAQSASADNQDEMNDWRMEEQDSPSIKEFQTLPVHTHSRWTDPILSFLRDGRLPPNPKEAKKVQKRAAWFTVLNDEFYKRGFSQPYLRCIEEDEARYVLEEVHEGICGDHMGHKSLVRKIIRAGYFWPTMQQDAAKFVKRCNSCQRYGNV